MAEEMKKIALFIFNGDPMCFIHVLLNAIDLNENGYQVKIVIEGSAVKLIPELAEEGNPQNKLWGKVKSLGLVEGVCRACSNKMGASKDAEKQGLTLLDDMSGHPGMADYMDQGYEIITF